MRVLPCQLSCGFICTLCKSLCSWKKDVVTSSWLRHTCKAIGPMRCVIKRSYLPQCVWQGLLKAPQHLVKPLLNPCMHVTRGYRATLTILVVSRFTCVRRVA